MTLEEQITKSSKDCLDYLAFSNYEFNRILNPEISPQRWGLVYGAEMVKKMEDAFQAKKSLTIDI